MGRRYFTSKPGCSPARARDSAKLKGHRWLLHWKSPPGIPTATLRISSTQLQGSSILSAANTGCRSRVDSRFQPLRGRMAYLYKVPA